MNYWTQGLLLVAGGVLLVVVLTLEDFLALTLLVLVAAIVRVWV